MALIQETPTLLQPALPIAEPKADDRTPHPYRSSARTLLFGYMALTIVLLAVGLLLTHALDGTVGRWDEHVNDYFARHRTGSLNAVTKVATASLNTLPVIVAAALLVGFLSWRRRLAEAAFLTLALVLEITVFLSVTFVVGRPRPSVPRLNSTPSTSSFPSGHTAAATVLFVGAALIVVCCTRNNLARIGSALLSVAVAFTVGFARVYRGLHHPTDVIAGLLFGLACLAVAALAVRAAQKKRLTGATAASAVR